MSELFQLTTVALVSDAALGPIVNFALPTLQRYLDVYFNERNYKIGFCYHFVIYNLLSFLILLSVLIVSLVPPQEVVQTVKSVDKQRM